MKGHALRLGIDVTRLGGAVATMPISSPAPLDQAAVAATVSSSMRWAEAIRKLGLAETAHNYKRVQRIAQAAGVCPQTWKPPAIVKDYAPPGVPAPPPVTVGKGVRSEGAVMNALIAAGYNVLIPFGVARYDLVIETVDGFKRVQCKTARVIRGKCMEFNVSSTPPGGRPRPYRGEVEFFGVYLPKTGDVYLIPMEEVQGCSQTACFRLAGAAEDPGGTHYAAPYRLVAQQDRALVS